MRTSAAFIIALILAGAVTSVYHHTQQGKIAYYRAKRLYEDAAYEEAIPLYEKAKEAGFDKKTLYKELAYSYLWTARAEDSVSLLEKAVLADPSDMNAWRSLADAYAWSGEYRRAEKVLQYVIGITDALSEKRKLAELYIWQGEFEKATELLAFLFQKYPDDEDVLLSYGRALHYSGRSEEASRVLEIFFGEESFVE